MTARSPDPLAPAPRTMTADDWKALHLVQRLGEQIVLHGKVALDNFAAAMKEVA